MMRVESWLNAQLMNRLNQHTEIMAQHLAEDLVHLATIALAPHGIPQLCLDHAEGRLNM
jgi:hypothetical protein